MRSLKVAAFAFAAVLAGASSAADRDWMKSVGEALGKAATRMPGGIYRVGLPRSDLEVA